MVSVSERFSANLVRCRRRAGLSQEKVAFRASLHRTEIGHLEGGTRLPRIDTLMKLAGALGVAPGELLDGIAWERGQSESGRFLDG
jgi:transcriptional regulator with XRE-family HTH domain